MTVGPLRPAVFHILLALAREERHGLGIADAVDQATDGAVRLGPGTLYRTLKELVIRDWIREVPARSADDDPRRRFYAITDTGREAVTREAERLQRVLEVARDAELLPDRP